MKIDKKAKKRVASIAFVLAGVVGSSASAFAAENPMDDVGVLHNAYLGCLQKTGGSIEDSLIRLVEKCGFDPGMSADAFVKAYQPVIEMDPTIPLAEKMLPYRKRYSAYEFSYFERMDSIFISATDFNEADKMLAKLENEAVANIDPATSNGANILASLSVARHSLRYWSEYSVNTENGSTARRRWWQWALIIVGDCAGLAVSWEAGPIAAIGVTASASEAVNEMLGSGQ